MSYLAVHPMTVSGVSPDVSAGVLVAGTAGLELTFTEPPTTGRAEGANHTLFRAGADRRLGTDDDVPVPVTAAVSGEYGTRLSFPGLTEDLYRLTVGGNLRDGAGNRIDGNRDGVPGDEWVRDFVVNAGPGHAPDATFGSGGTAHFGAGAANIPRAVATGPDGSIFSAGLVDLGGNSDTVVFKTRPDGTPDAGFGNAGRVIVPLSPGQVDRAEAVVVQPDGKVVVAGYAAVGGVNFMAMARLLPDGSPDASFGAGGIVLSDFGDGYAVAYSVAVGTDGTIVLAGEAGSGTASDMAVARFTAAGAPDLTFDTDGRARVDFAGSFDHAYAVTVRPDGKIVVAGSAYVASSDMAVARLNADGSPDAGFGVNGKVTVPLGPNADHAYAVLSRDDGKIVLGGRTYNGTNYDLAVVRLLSSGGLDTSLNGDGIITADLGGAENVLGLVAGPAGSVVAVGSTTSGDGAFLAAFTNPGEPDPAFDGDGRLAPFAGGGIVGAGAARQPDGKIIVLGRDAASDAGQFALTRLTTGSFPTRVTTPLGDAFDIDTSARGAGSLIEGPDNAFDGLNRLEVGGREYSPAGAADAPVQVRTARAVGTNRAETAATWADIPGLAVLNFTLETTRTLRLSGHVVARSSSRQLGIFQLVVDGANSDTPSDATFEAGQFESVELNDVVTLGPGVHTIKVQAYWTGNTTAEYDVSSDLRVVEYRVPGVEFHEAITPGVAPAAQAADTWLNVPGLTKQFTVEAGGKAVEVTAQVNARSDTFAQRGRVRLLIDGQALSLSDVDSSEHYSPAGAWVTHNLLERLDLAPGVHTVTVQAYWESGGTVLYDYWSNLRITELPNRADGSRPVAVHKTGRSSGAFDPPVNVWTPAPNQTVSFDLPAGRWVALEARMKTDGDVDRGVGFRFTVDGAARDTRTFSTNETGDFTSDTFDLADLVYLGPGRHTVTVEGYWKAAGVASIEFGSYVRAVEYLERPAVATDDGFKTVVTPAQPLAGLRVSREVTVSEIDGVPYARTIDVYANPTGAAISTTARTHGNLGGNIGYLTTSDGDGLPEVTDRWLLTGEKADGTGQAVLHLFRGPNGLAPSAVASDGTNVEWTYPLNVPAGATVRIVYFTILGNTHTRAVATADALVGTDGVGEANLFLDDEEIVSILNVDSLAAITTQFADGVLRITGGSKNDTITLTENAVGDILLNNKLIVGSPATSNVTGILVEGGDGADKVKLTGLTTWTGPATLSGGAGIDHLTGGLGNDVLQGGAGNDVLAGGAGTDTVREFGDLDFVLTATRLAGKGTSLTPASLTTGTDMLSSVEAAFLGGGILANKLDATAFVGKTTLLGGGGHDTLLGGTNWDILDGGEGDDLLTGFGGNDVLAGRGGNDLLRGGADDDIFDGGADTDIIEEAGDVNFILGSNTLTGVGFDILNGVEGARLTGGKSNNTLTAAASSINVTLSGGLGNDTLIGGSGFTTVAETGIVNLTLTNTTLTGAGTDQLTAIDAAILTGGAGPDKLDASAFTGPVTLDGGAGNDTLLGGIGDDLLTGGIGSDTLDGGLGADTLAESANMNFVLTNTKLTGLGTDTLAGIEKAVLTGGTGANRLDASAFTGRVTLDGGAGNDTLTGGGNDDVLNGGAGDDQVYTLGDANVVLTNSSLTGYGTDTLLGVETALLVGFGGANNINASGFTGRTTIDGGGGDDTLTGGTNADVIRGGIGNDSLIGLDGNDTFDGGAGTDTADGGAGTDLVLGNSVEVKLNIP